MGRRYYCSRTLQKGPLAHCALWDAAAEIAARPCTRTVSLFLSLVPDRVVYTPVSASRCQSHSHVLHAMMDVAASNGSPSPPQATGGPWSAMASLKISPTIHRDTAPSMSRPTGGQCDCHPPCQTPHVHDRGSRSNPTRLRRVSSSTIASCASEREETNHRDLTRVAWFLVLQIIYFI